MTQHKFRRRHRHPWRTALNFAAALAVTGAIIITARLADQIAEVFNQTTQK